jgi:glycosyltransferase involved in cell wall biosynthesis
VDHLACLVTSPGRYFAGLRLALSMSPPGLVNLLYQLFYFAEAGVLSRHLRREGVSHLHNHFGNSSCSVAVLASTISGVPYSYTMHGPAIFFEPLRWRIDEKIARARFVSCISHFCRSQGMLFARPEHWSRMHIVHCGVVPSLYAPVRHEAGRKRILFVGRIEAIKGLPILLDSARRLRREHPELRITLVGDGGDRKWLEQRAEEMGLGDVVEFTGYQSQAQVAEHLGRTDVFVLPSFAEGVPVVLMEAMCGAVPVVATQVAGVGELVEDGLSGYIVPPGDAATLTARIDALLRDVELRQRLGDAGRAKVLAEFDIRKETRWLHGIMQFYATGRGAQPGLRPDRP